MCFIKQFIWIIPWIQLPHKFPTICLIHLDFAITSTKKKLYYLYVVTVNWYCKIILLQYQWELKILNCFSKLIYLRIKFHWAILAVKSSILTFIIVKFAVPSLITTLNIHYKIYKFILYTGISLRFVMVFENLNLRKVLEMFKCKL